VAVVGVQVRTDEVPQGAVRSHVADVAGAREDEAEPEAEERVREVVADGAGGRRLAGQGIASLDVAQLDELLEVVGEAPRVLAPLPGDLLHRALARGDGRQDDVIEGYLPELFPQQEVGLAVEGGVFVQEFRGDVRLDRASNARYDLSSRDLAIWIWRRGAHRAEFAQPGV